MNNIKIRLILWFLGKKMVKAARTNAKFQQKLEGRELTYQVVAGSLGRYFQVENNQVRSVSGVADLPDCTMRFTDAETAIKVLTASKPEVFMHAIQDAKLKIEGDFSLVQWFQGAAKAAMKA